MKEKIVQMKQQRRIFSVVIFVLVLLMGSLGANRASAVVTQGSQGEYVYVQDFTNSGDMNSQASTGDWNTAKKQISLHVVSGSSSESYVYASSSVIVSDKVNDESVNVRQAYLRIIGGIEDGTMAKYYISADGGQNWQQFEADASDQPVYEAFINPGSDLRWKVEMSSENSNLSPIISELDIYFTTSTQTIEPPVPPVTPTPVPTTTFLNGTLIRASDNPAVYAVWGSRKLWIASSAQLLKMGGKWSDVQTVSAETVASLPALKLVHAVGSASIYYLTDAGLKKLIPSDAVFQSYGDRYEDVVQVNSNVLDSMPTVNFIKPETGVDIFQLTGGNKKWIKTAAEFKKAGGIWINIAPVNVTELNAYSTVGDAPTSATGAVTAGELVDGDLIRAVGSSDVYIVKLVGEKKFRRLILSPSVFKSYKHLKWTNVKIVSADTLAQYSVSNLVTLDAIPNAGSAIYMLTAAGDGGSKQQLSFADVTNGGYDPASIYQVNQTDLNSYKG
jgi:hypothetical protein